jgi:hypothetical protein
LRNASEDIYTSWCFAALLLMSGKRCCWEGGLVMYRLFFINGTHARTSETYHTEAEYGTSGKPHCPSHVCLCSPSLFLVKKEDGGLVSSSRDVDTVDDVCQRFENGMKQWQSVKFGISTQFFVLVCESSSTGNIPNLAGRLIVVHVSDSNPFVLYLIVQYRQLQSKSIVNSQCTKICIFLEKELLKMPEVLWNPVKIIVIVCATQRSKHAGSKTHLQQSQQSRLARRGVPESESSHHEPRSGWM